MTVFVSQSVQSRNKYHTEMCRNAEEIAQIREVSQTEAEKMGLAECLICSGDENMEEGNDWSYQNALREAARE